MKTGESDLPFSSMKPHQLKTYNDDSYDDEDDPETLFEEDDFLKH